MAANSVKSNTHPHIEWLELHADGILHECAILKTDQVGNKLYFPINYLDAIDKNRLSMILQDRNITNFELWDVMRQKTLGNGVNALAYFHQYAKMYAANGKILDPKAGQVGVVSTGVAKAA